MPLMRLMMDALGAFGPFVKGRLVPVQRRLEPGGQEHRQQDDCDYLAPPFSHGTAKIRQFTVTCKYRPVPGTGRRWLNICIFAHS